MIAREIGQPIYEGAPEEKLPLDLARSRPPRKRQQRPRRAAGGYRRPPAHRRRAHGRAAATQRAAQSRGDPVRGRRHDRPGRRQIGRRVPQAPRHHRRHPHQDGWRRPRRRGALHPPRHRPAAEVRRRGREVRRAGAVPSRPRGQPHPGHGRHPLLHREGQRGDRPETSRGDAAQAHRERLHAGGFPRPVAADPQARARSAACWT